MPERTIADLYDALQTLNVQVAVMCEKLDTIAGNTHDHEKRIRLLEGRRWPLPSLAIVLSTLALLVAFVRGS